MFLPIIITMGFIIGFFISKTTAQSCLDWDPTQIYNGLDLFSIDLKFKMLCDNKNKPIPDINQIKYDWCIDETQPKTFSEYAYCKSL